MDESTREEVRELLKYPPDCGLFPGHPAYKDPEHWCIGPVIEHRDSGLLDRGNAKALIEALEAREDLQEMWEPHDFRHWAVGWVKHMSFRVLGDDGEPTPMFHFMKEWEAKLDDYPVADEEAYSALEFEAAIENIESIASGWVRKGVEDWVGEVYHWLSDHEPGELDNRDGNGAWPAEDAIVRALKANGIYLNEDEEEFEA